MDPMDQFAPVGNDRLLASLAFDYGLLRDAASSGAADAPVPSCPGWTMTDLVQHVAEVYLHKVTAIRLGEWPDPWPPDLSAEPPLTLLDRTYEELIAEFASRDPAAPAPTWYEPQQDIAFWIRRMAQETVIHRIDAEQAAGRPLSPVPDDIAVDGIDEVLKRFLAYGSVTWPEEFAEVTGERLESASGLDTVAVAAGSGTWTVRPRPGGVQAADGSSGEVHATVTARPPAMLCWLWGRAGDEVITVSGDPAWAAYLRRLLAAMTR
jgi:uncharacterized protein (TIGR03083 family)